MQDEFPKFFKTKIGKLMKPRFEEVIKRINKLTDEDMKQKTPIQLYLSAVEELGELTREIKIEEKVPGNAHKQPDEGSKAEAVDLFICAVCRIRSLEITENLIPKNDNFSFAWQGNHNNVFDLLELCAINLGKSVGCETSYIKREAAIDLGQQAINIFLNRDGNSYEEFIKICHRKLDKWEKTKGIIK